MKLASGQESKYVVFGGFADILPTGCTVLAESALPLSDLTRDRLQAHIETARSNAGAAVDYEQKTRLEEYLSQLTQLNETILPA